MAKVTGIGGIFITANENEALQKWYEECLGVPRGDHGANEFKWKEMSGKEASSIFWIANTNDDYFKPSKSPYIINFRVDDLEALLADLRAKGAQTSAEIKDETYGRFGWVTDPSATKIELWQPK